MKESTPPETWEPLIKSIGDSVILDGLSGKARIAGNGGSLGQIRNADQNGRQGSPEEARPGSQDRQET